jgi:hypothetical protein
MKRRAAAEPADQGLHEIDAWILRFREAHAQRIATDVPPDEQPRERAMIEALASELRSRLVEDFIGRQQRV